DQRVGADRGVAAGRAGTQVDRHGIRCRRIVGGFRSQEIAIFGRGPWLDHHDTAMLPFYRIASAEEGFAWLRARGVRYVYLPWYLPPTFSRTVAMAIVGDPRMVIPVAFHRGAALYRLEDAASVRPCVSAGE